jgi:glycosyltransferase involved in cell wall biosynthesis
LKITFLLTQSLESPSGLGRYWPLAKELARLGHEVSILALHHNLLTQNERYFLRDGVKIYYVGQMHVLKKGNIKFYFSPIRLIWVAALATLRIAATALRIPSDVYHLGKPHPMNGLAALILHLFWRCPIYLDCDDYEAASNRFQYRWQKQVVSFFEDQLPKIVAGITVNTHFIIERLDRLGYSAKRIVYVPNGVDRQRFCGVEEISKEVLRRKIGLEGQKIVVYVGSLSLVNHAVDLLLEAFAIVQRSEPNAKLLLVGGGEDYKALQYQARILGLEGKVWFIGRVSPEVVPFFYRLADVSVDPVRGDLAEMARFPLKLVESIAVGTPVITGDLGDRRLIVRNGGGLLVVPGDPTSLAEAIKAVLSDSVLRLRLSAEALAIREQYYWDRLVYKFLKVYNT